MYLGTVPCTTVVYYVLLYLKVQVRLLCMLLLLLLYVEIPSDKKRRASAEIRLSWKFLGQLAI